VSTFIDIIGMIVALKPEFWNTTSW